MIKFENYEVVGWEHTIRGMRNPMNSWDRSDSGYKCPYYNTKETVCSGCNENMCIGPNDHDLMQRLASGRSDDRKFMRMITVYLDVTAPLYWWKEFDTYKVGTVANSCSTMHKIHSKPFEIDDFSHEHLISNKYKDVDGYLCISPIGTLIGTIEQLNSFRELYLETKDKKYWWQMIQLLPSSYNQKRTVMLNYEVLKNIYHARKNHKLDEWHYFCDWIESLPYSELITGGN